MLLIMGKRKVKNNMFCVNVEIIKTVINNYSKNIVDWLLDSVKKDNNVNINTNTFFSCFIFFHHNNYSTYNVEHKEFKFKNL